MSFFIQWLTKVKSWDISSARADDIQGPTKQHFHWFLIQLSLSSRTRAVCCGHFSWVFLDSTARRSCLSAHSLHSWGSAYCTSAVFSQGFPKSCLRILAPTLAVAVRAAWLQEPWHCYMLSWNCYSSKCLHRPWESGLWSDEVVRIFYTTLYTYLPSYKWARESTLCFLSICVPGTPARQSMLTSAKLCCFPKWARERRDTSTKVYAHIPLKQDFLYHLRKGHTCCL